MLPTTPYRINKEEEEGGVRTPEPEGPRPERGAFDHFATSPNKAKNEWISRRHKETGREKNKQPPPRKNPSPPKFLSQVPFLNEHSKRQQAETAPSLRNMNPALYRLSYPRVEKKIFSCEERGSIPRPQGNSPSRPSKTRRAPRRQTKTERKREFCEKEKVFFFRPQSQTVCVVYIYKVSGGIEPPTIRTAAESSTSEL